MLTRDFEKKIIKIGDSEIIIGSVLGKVDPFIPLLEQVEIRVVSGTKVIRIKFPFSDKWEDYVKEIRNLASSLEEFSDLIENYYKGGEDSDVLESGVGSESLSV